MSCMCRMCSTLSTFRSSRRFKLAAIFLLFFTTGFISRVVDPIISSLVPSTQVERKQVIFFLFLWYPLGELLGGATGAALLRGSNNGPAWYTGTFFLVLGTILFSVRDNLAALLFGRLLHGLGSGTLFVMGFSVLMDLVKIRSAGTYIGIVISCSAFGAVVAPIMGAFLYEREGNIAGKAAICLVMLVLTVVTALMRITMRSIPGETPAVEFDRESSVRSTGVDAVHPVRPMRREGAQRSRQVRQALSRAFAAFYGELSIVLILCALAAVLPGYINTLVGNSGFPAGLLFIPIGITSWLNPLAGAMSDYYGARWITASAFFFTAVALVPLFFFDNIDLSAVYLILGIAIAAIGLFSTAILTPLATEFPRIELSRWKLDWEGTPAAHNYAGCFMVLNTALAIARGVGPLAGEWLYNTGGWRGFTVALAIIGVSGSLSCLSFSGERTTAPRADAESEKHESENITRGGTETRRNNNFEVVPL